MGTGKPVEVRARVSGYLESVNFTDGQLVEKGDLLFVIEPRPFELALETAKAEQSQAEAQLQLAQAQLERTAQLRHAVPGIRPFWENDLRVLRQF